MKKITRQVSKKGPRKQVKEGKPQLVVNAQALADQLGKAVQNDVEKLIKRFEDRVASLEQTVKALEDRLTASLADIETDIGALYDEQQGGGESLAEGGSVTVGDGTEEMTPEEAAAQVERDKRRASGEEAAEERRLLAESQGERVAHTGQLLGVSDPIPPSESEAKVTLAQVFHHSRPESD